MVCYGIMCCAVLGVFYLLSSGWMGWDVIRAVLAVFDFVLCNPFFLKKRKTGFLF